MVDLKGDVSTYARHMRLHRVGVVVVVMVASSLWATAVSASTVWNPHFVEEVQLTAVQIATRIPDAGTDTSPHSFVVFGMGGAVAGSEWHPVALPQDPEVDVGAGHLAQIGILGVIVRSPKIFEQDGRRANGCSARAPCPLSRSRQTQTVMTPVRAPQPHLGEGPEIDRSAVVQLRDQAFCSILKMVAPNSASRKEIPFVALGMFV